MNINDKTKLTGDMTGLNSTPAKYKFKKQLRDITDRLPFDQTLLRITIEPAFRMISGRKTFRAGELGYSGSYSGTRGWHAGVPKPSEVDKLRSEHSYLCFLWSLAEIRRLVSGFFSFRVSCGNSLPRKTKVGPDRMSVICYQEP